VPGIYAIGDVTGKIQLAHVASAQGLVAAENITGHSKKMRYDVVPSCVYTEPEIASIGLTEAQVKEKGLAYKVGRFATAANGRSMIMGESAGSVKLITEEKTGELLGCHIMAPRATDMIGEIAAAMRAEGTIEELSDTTMRTPRFPR
jgi:dihydrolipoamide dehydrogenase